MVTGCTLLYTRTTSVQVHFNPGIPTPIGSPHQNTVPPMHSTSCISRVPQRVVSLFEVLEGCTYVPGARTPHLASTHERNNIAVREPNEQSQYVSHLMREQAQASHAAAAGRGTDSEGATLLQGVHNGDVLCSRNAGLYTQLRGGVGPLQSLLEDSGDNQGSLYVQLDQSSGEGWATQQQWQQQLVRGLLTFTPDVVVRKCRKILPTFGSMELC